MIGKVQPVIQVTPSGETVPPLGAADLAGLAKSTDVQALPHSVTRMIQRTLDLAGLHADAPVDLGALTEIQSITVRELTAGSLSLRFGSLTAESVQVAKGELREGLNGAGLWYSNPAGGGTAQLEIHGR